MFFAWRFTPVWRALPLPCMTLIAGSPWRRVAAGAGAKPDRRRPAAPAQPAPQTPPAQPGDPFGEDTALTAKTDRLREGHRQLGQRLRDDHRLIQEDQNLCRQGGHQGRRPADDDLHRDRRHRLRVPGGDADRRTAEEPAAWRDRRSASRRRATRSNSSIAALMTDWTIPTRRSPIISTRSGSKPRTCSSRNM